MIIYEPPKAATHIPIVDFADAFSPDLEARRKVAEEVHKACRDTGFFYIVNHGAPDAMIDDLWEASRAFFALPAEVKDTLHIDRSPHRRGYEPLGLQTLDEGAPPDLKEAMNLGREAEDASDEEGAPNPWPPLEGFEAAVKRYQAQMTRLGRSLGGVLALSLDLPEDYFAEALARPSCTVRLLRYPPQPANAAFNQLGSGAHTDWGMLTLLLQDEVGGLEVRNRAGEWIRADPVPGSFVVNLGDMIPRITNGLYTSNFHRVMNRASARPRYSVATFFNPGSRYIVDCVPTLRPKDWRPNPETFGEHIQAMVRKTYSPGAA